MFDFTLCFTAFAFHDLQTLKVSSFIKENASQIPDITLNVDSEPYYFRSEWRVRLWAKRVRIFIRFVTLDTLVAKIAGGERYTCNRRPGSQRF